MISWFYEAPPSETRDGFWLVSCCDSLNHQCTSKCHVPHLSGMCSGCIVNNDIINIAYRFEPDWEPKNISEEDRAER